MIRSTERILTTHVGRLPRPEELRDLVMAKNSGQPYDAARYEELLSKTVHDVVRKQIETGIDIITDGEVSKPNFLLYVRERLSGLVERPNRPGIDSPPSSIYARDAQEFGEYFAQRGGRGVTSRVFAVEPITYTGQAALQKDIDNLKAALAGVSPAEVFMPSVAPGVIDHLVANEYYKNDEEMLFAIAEAMSVEYRTIVDAGFILQIDNPDLPDAWQIHPEMSLEEYRKYARVRIEALNHGLRGIPPERVRLHACWGSYYGPHKYDIPLRDVVDLMLSVPAGAYSVEASNPMHEHEWRVWEDVKLPEGKVLIPGVVGHFSDFIEHPELIAQRLVRLAKIVGRENVIASSDCGLGERVGHPSIVWAKFQAMAEGARLATKELWS